MNMEMRTFADNAPKKGETYYYIFANSGNEKFEIKSTEWLDSIFDAFRFSRGNVFLSRKDAEELLEIKKKYKRPRRTAIIDENGKVGDIQVRLPKGYVGDDTSYEYYPNSPEI